MKAAARIQTSWGGKFKAQEAALPGGLTEQRLPEIVSTAQHYSASLTGTTFTWSHTVDTGITDPIAIVIIGHSGTGANSHFPTAVTFGGSTMTEIEDPDGQFARALNDGTDGHPRFQRWYYLLAPPTGAQTISVTMNSATSVNVDCTSSIWRYVPDADSIGDVAVAQANTGTSISATVAETTSAERILACAVVRNAFPSPDGTLTYHDNWSYATSTYSTFASKAGGADESASFSWPSTNPPNNNTLVLVTLKGGTYPLDLTPPPPSSEFDTTIAAAYGGGTFSRVFFDDFDTNVAEGNFLNNAAYSGKWDAYGTNFYMTNQNPANGGNGDHYGGNTNLSVANSELILRMYRDSATGKALGAAPVMRLPGSTVYQTYGRYVVRFRCLENVPGWKVAWLLWPLTDDNGTKRWPQGGEFDFLEGSLNANMGAFHHWYNGTNGGAQDAWGSGTPFATSYHTLVAEWTPNYVRTVIDGVEIGKRTSATSPGGTSYIVPNPMRAVLQCETNLGGTQPGTPATQRIALDKVAVYSWAA